MVENNSTNLTGLILTYNEEDNIKRVLDKLLWLEKIVVVDSFSTDSTLSILATYSNVEVHQRAFDSFAEQCNFGLSLISSPWVLSLDADYVITEDLANEITEKVKLKSDVVAYYCHFHFLVFGEKLLNDNTTPRAVLFRTGSCNYYNDGHAHRLKIDGLSGKSNKQDFA